MRFCHQMANVWKGINHIGRTTRSGRFIRRPKEIEKEVAIFFLKKKKTCIVRGCILAKA